MLHRYYCKLFGRNSNYSFDSGVFSFTKNYAKSTTPHKAGSADELETALKGEGFGTTKWGGAEKADGGGSKMAMIDHPLPSSSEKAGLALCACCEFKVAIYCNAGHCDR